MSNPVNWSSKPVSATRQAMIAVMGGVLLSTAANLQSVSLAASPQANANSSESRQNFSSRKDDSQEWLEVEQWMKNHCINQWTFYNNRLADRPAAQQRARKLMIEQYRRISSTRDAQMREALTNQASYRDNIFGIVLGYRRHQIRRTEADSRIQVEADKLADIEIFVRQARIRELENEIKDLEVRRKDYMARVSNKELQQADLPPGKLSATGDADVLEDTADRPTRKPGSTTRPSN